MGRLRAFMEMHILQDADVFMEQTFKNQIHKPYVRGVIIIRDEQCVPHT